MISFALALLTYAGYGACFYMGFWAGQKLALVADAWRARKMFEKYCKEEVSA
jgi:hypothetical protein